MQFAILWWHAEVVNQRLAKLLRADRRNFQALALRLEAGKHSLLQLLSSLVQQQSRRLSPGARQKLRQLRFEVLARVKRHLKHRWRPETVLLDQSESGMSGKGRRIVVRVTALIRVGHDDVGFRLLQESSYFFCQSRQTLRGTMISDCKINYAVFGDVCEGQRREAFHSARLRIIRTVLESGGNGIVHVTGRSVGNMKDGNIDEFGDETARAHNFIGGVGNYYRAPHPSCEIARPKKPGMS